VSLTAPADGQTLEGIIGELQSQYGVPQYPQEYRITIRVADDKDSRPEPSPVEERKREAPPTNSDGPRREKAPAAPVLMREGTTQPSPNKKRRRGRRGRRRRGGASGDGSASS